MSKLNLSIYDRGKDTSYPVLVSSNDKIEKIKGVIHFYTQVGNGYQLLVHNGCYLVSNETVGSRNIKNHDIIQFHRLTSLNRSNPLQGVNLKNISVENLRRYILNYEELRVHVQKNIPDLYRAVTATSPNMLQGYLNQLRSKLFNVQPPQQFQQQPKNKWQIREDRIRGKLRENPMDVDAQKELEELIRDRNLEENYQTAASLRPELFTRVHMLYIPGKVNDIKVKVFVDSGAQMTIMGKKFAEKCGVMRLCDKRFQGMATGVGTAKIVGRVHLFRIMLGNSFFEHSLTILESDMNLLLGLDFLKAHRCLIDLKENCLCIGKEKIDFLKEHEVPKSLGAQSPRTPVPQSPSLTNDHKIKILTNMGVTRDQAIQLLEKTNGNVEYAASLIFENFSN